MRKGKSDKGKGDIDAESGRQHRDVCPARGTNGVKSWEERMWKQVKSQWQELKREKLKRSGAAQ